MENRKWRVESRKQGGTIQFAAELIWSTYLGGGALWGWASVDRQLLAARKRLPEKPGDLRGG